MDIIKEGMAERLQQVLDEHGDNANSLATKIHSANSNIYKFLDKEEKHLPNVRGLIKILETYPELEPRWFLTGQGPKFAGDDVFNRPIDDFKSLCLLLDAVESLVSSTKDSKWQVYRNCLLETFNKHINPERNHRDEEIKLLKERLGRLEEDKQDDEL